MAQSIMENHPLLLGLKSRLESGDYKLKDKLSLINNLYKSGVVIPYKDNVVLDWIFTTLDQKYSDSNIKKKDLHKFWSLLNMCLKNAIEKGVKLSLNVEILFNLADKAELCHEPTVECFSAILAIQSKNWSNQEILDLCLKLLQKEVCPPGLLLNILDILQQCPALVYNSGALLAHASRHCTQENLDKLEALCRHYMFNNCDAFSEFFNHLGETDEKYACPVEVNIFMEYLANHGDVGTVLRSTRDPSLPSSLRTRLFVLFVHMSGQPQYSQKEALLLAKIQVSLETKPDLSKVILNSLPLDTEFAHVVDKSEDKTVTASRVLCEALIEVIDSGGMNEQTFEVLQEVHCHHPSVLETLAPLVVARCVESSASEACLPVFNLVVDLMLKLRQFPKLISKVLLYLRNESEDTEVSVSQEYCDIIGRAVIQIPRVQNLEIWKIVLYHLNTDFIPHLKDENKDCTKFWSVCAPVLASVIKSGQLLDHNVPEPLVVRIKDLVGTTFNTILRLEHHQFPAESQRFLYETFVSDFLEFVNLLTLYKNVEFSDIEDFKDRLLSELTKTKNLGGYEKLVKMELRSKSKHEMEICQVFRQQLAYQPQLIAGNILTIDESPQDSTEDKMEVEESPAWVALFLHQCFVKIDEQVGDYGKLTDSKLWSQDCDWHDRETIVCNLIKNELPGVFERKCGAVSVPDLNKLPLENLPAVLQLACTLICVHCVLSSPSQETAVLLARCLQDTHIFRYVDSSVLLTNLLNLNIELPSCLLDRLARELTRYQKMLSEIERGYSVFNNEIQEGKSNYVHMMSLLLGRLVNLSPSAEERKTIANSLASKILKSLMKMGKHEMSGKELPYHVKSAIAIIEMKEELEGKTEKYLRKVLTATVDTQVGLDLVHKLLVSDDRFNKFVDLQVLTSAWDVILGTDLSEDQVKVASLILENVESSDLTSLLDRGDRYKIARVLITIKPTEENQAVKEKLESMLLEIVRDDKIEHEDKVSLLLHLSEARPSPVSVSVESAAISLVLSHCDPAAEVCRLPCSSRTAAVLNAFVRNHPNRASKYSPVVMEAARLHIKHVARATTDCDETDCLRICNTLLAMFNTLKKKKSEWGSLAPYLAGDLMTALLAVTSQQVKQLLVAAAHALLSISEDYTHEYISANLPSAANEMFKLVLQDFKTNYKFTGRDV